MKLNDKKSLKRLFDQVKVQEPSTHFERRIFQDWQRSFNKTEKSHHAFSDVLTLAKLHPKLLVLIAIVAVTASVFLGQHLLMSQDEGMHRIDALSELSLSTI